MPASAGANAELKVETLAAGMVAGAESIQDMDLRGYQFGHLRQLDAVVSLLLVNLAEQTPLLGGADQAPCVDVDDTM